MLYQILYGKSFISFAKGKLVEIIFYILAKAVSIFLSLISFSMLGRVLLQFFVNPEENLIFAICVFVSEPFILPFRFVLAKLGIGQDSPLDIAFMLAYISLTAISIFLPVI